MNRITFGKRPCLSKSHLVIGIALILSLIVVLVAIFSMIYSYVIAKNCRKDTTIASTRIAITSEQNTMITSNVTNPSTSTNNYFFFTNSIKSVPTTQISSYSNSTILTSTASSYKSMLVPYYYDINLKVIFDGTYAPFWFEGSLNISFECIINTNLITLKSRSLDINLPSIVIYGISDVNFELRNFKFNYNSNKIEIYLERNYLKENHTYSIIVDYIKEFDNDTVSFQIGNYVDAFERKKYYFMSNIQKENIDEVFPLLEFSKPIIIKLKVTHDKTLNAISTQKSISSSLM